VAKRRNKHVGSSFDEFLRTEGLHEEVTTLAWKRVLAWEVSEAMRKGRISERDGKADGHQPQPARAAARSGKPSRPARDRPEGCHRRRQAAHDRIDGRPTRGLMLRFASTAPSPAAGAVTTFFVKPHGLTSFASIDSAGCFFRRAFSAPSALSRLASDKSMPPNLRRQR